MPFPALCFVLGLISFTFRPLVLISPAAFAKADKFVWGVCLLLWHLQPLREHGLPQQSCLVPQSFGCCIIQGCLSKGWRERQPKAEPGTCSRQKYSYQSPQRGLVNHGRFVFILRSLSLPPALVTEIETYCAGFILPWLYLPCHLSVGLGLDYLKKNKSPGGRGRRRLEECSWGAGHCFGAQACPWPLWYSQRVAVAPYIRKLANLGPQRTRDRQFGFLVRSVPDLGIKTLKSLLTVWEWHNALN